MCRLAAYLGPTIRLEQFLLEPAHSLLVQAHSPQELRFANFNADGFGVGWYESGQPSAYTNPMPIWSDSNLPHLARSLNNSLWLAAVRSATVPFSTCMTNTQPFFDRELIFFHNGFIEDFADMRRTLRDYLNPAIENDILGNTDSEHLFALLRHLLAEDPELPIEDAIAEMFNLIDAWIGGKQGLINLAISDGDRVFAARYGLNADCPSLYYCTESDSFPGGQLLASEKLTDDEFWQTVPEHHILTLDRNQPPELLAL